MPILTPALNAVELTMTLMGKHTVLMGLTALACAYKMHYKLLSVVDLWVGSLNLKHEYLKLKELEKHI